MRPSDNLFELIKSLNPSEKRHFKLYAQRHILGDENNYLKLFETVDKQIEYDEAALKKKYHNEKFVQQIHVAKNYLYNLILKSLNEYHTIDTANIQLRELLNSAEILFGKGLYKQASKILIKLKDKAYRYERQIYVLEVIVLENKIAFALQDMEVAKKVIIEGAKEEELLLKDYQNARQYKYLSDKLKIFIKTKGTVKGEEDTTELESIIEHPLLNDEKNAISYSTKYSFFHVFSKYYSVKEDYKNAYPYCNKLVHLIEAHPEQITKNPQAYLLAVNHLLTILKELRKFDEFEMALKKLKAVQSKTIHFQSRAFAYIFIHEWNLSFYTGKYQQCISLIPFLEEGIQKYDNQITSDIKLLFYFNVFYCCFVIKQYQQAIKWLNKILNDKRTEIRQDIRNFGMVVNIILHYEMKDYDLLEYLIRSAQRLFEKEKNDHKFELLVLMNMKKLIKGHSSSEERKMFMKLRNKLLFANLENYLIAFSHGSSEKVILNTFDILSWLESKIEDRPFEVVLFEKEKDKQKPLIMLPSEGNIKSKK
jgi:hypothetical protein